MSDYTQAPATALLATHCACCGRELLDAVSVQVGIGPTCREKHGYDAGPIEHRAEANTLISAIARARHDVVAGKLDAIRDVAGKLKALAALGFCRCADHLAVALAKVRITEHGDRLIVHTPYNAEATVELRKLRGRRWNPEVKANLIHVEAARDLHAVLVKFFAPCLAIGRKGAFSLEAQ